MVILSFLSVIGWEKSKEIDFFFLNEKRCDNLLDITSDYTLIE